MACRKKTIKYLLGVILTLINLTFLQFAKPSIVKAQSNLSEKNIKKISLDDQYVIDTGDILEIKIPDNLELSGTYQVLNDGAIIMPIIGRVNLRNLSIEESQLKIKQSLSKELISPLIFLKLKKARAIKFSLVGEINKPGIYSFGGNEDEKLSNFPTMIEAIRLGGGITKTANVSNVILRRRMPGENIEYKEAKLNLVDLILEGNHSQNPYLFDGDIIKISKVEEIKNSKDEISILKANLSPDKIEINVIGEVYKPGPLITSSSTNLTQAILKAGGPINWKANKGNVQLLRVRKNGSASLKKFKIDLKEDISNEKNPILMDGDIVRIKKSTFGSVTEGLSAVTEPVRDVFSIYTMFKIFDD